MIACRPFVLDDHERGRFGLRYSASLCISYSVRTSNPDATSSAVISDSSAYQVTCCSSCYMFVYIQGPRSCAELQQTFAFSETACNLRLHNDEAGMMTMVFCLITFDKAPISICLTYAEGGCCTSTELQIKSQFTSLFSTL